MHETENLITRRLKGQRGGMLRLMQSLGVSVVKYRYKGEFVTAELLDAARKPCMEVQPQHADSLRHIATSQLDANPGGPALWRRSAGTLEWILSADITLAQRNFPGSDHDLEAMGQDLRHVAGEQADSHGEPESEQGHPAMVG